MTCQTAQTLLLSMAATISALTNATVGRSAENVPPGTSAMSDTTGESAGASIPQVQPAEQNTQDFPAEVAEFESVNRSDLTDALAGDDPAFSRYVDLTLLERAMSDLNASLLADVALELAEGERVLVRPHECGLTSDKLVAKAAALALRMNDPETIKRLEQAADAMKKPAWTKALADANEFGGKSRDPGPSVSLGALEPNVVELANAVRRATDAAVLTSNKDDLESLKASVSESVQDETIKTYLIQSIDTSLKALPERLDPGDEFLAEFSSASRDKVVERKSQRGFFDRGSAAAYCATLTTWLTAKYPVFSGSNYSVRSGVTSYHEGPSWARITRYEAWAEAVWRNPFHGGSGGGGGGGQEYKIWIENPTRSPVHYKLNGDNFVVEPNNTRWHARRGNSDFNIEFDCSFEGGYQRRGYRLIAGRHHFFKKKGNGLDLHHRG